VQPFSRTHGVYRGTLETQATGYPQRNAEYTTTHVFIDEVLGHTENIHFYFPPGLANSSDVEIFTNLNRRHLARPRLRPQLGGEPARIGKKTPPHANARVKAAKGPTCTGDRRGLRPVYQSEKAPKEEGVMKPGIRHQESRQARAL
jgi:hypothetical protein